MHPMFHRLLGCLGFSPDAEGANAGPRGLKQRIEGWAVSVTVLSLLAWIVLDLRWDLESEADFWHLLSDVVFAAFAVLGVFALGCLLNQARRRARELQGHLREAREESRQLAGGVSSAMDEQFKRWNLSSSEREVALLMLKGLSMKEVASIRETSERTVRHQAQSIYSKSGIANRAELSAFFLEDLMLPIGKTGPAAQEPGAEPRL